MSFQLSISPAELGDIEAVLGILDEATKWLQESGIPTIWKLGGFSRQGFTDQISRGEVFIASVDRKAAGTFILQWDDTLFWGEQPPVAGYIHKFAVRPAYAGMGIGVEMLRWAEQATRAKGRRVLRLNCLAEDRKIRDYYETAGFVHRGDVDGPTAMASLYEKLL